VGIGVGTGVLVGVGVGVAVLVGVGIGARAACESENVSPAIVRTPLRASPLFNCTVAETRPGPVPDPPELITTHGATPVAVHAQSFGAVTLTWTLPPSALTDSVRGVMSY
jgi:hypothetical protein